KLAAQPRAVSTGAGPDFREIVSVAGKLQDTVARRVGDIHGSVGTDGDRGGMTLRVGRDFTRLPRQRQAKARGERGKLAGVGIENINQPVIRDGHVYHIFPSGVRFQAQLAKAIALAAWKADKDTFADRIGD